MTTTTDKAVTDLLTAITNGINTGSDVVMTNAADLATQALQYYTALYTFVNITCVVLLVITILSYMMSRRSYIKKYANISDYDKQFSSEYRNAKNRMESTSIAAVMISIVVSVGILITSILLLKITYAPKLWIVQNLILSHLH